MLSYQNGYHYERSISFVCGKNSIAEPSRWDKKVENEQEGLCWRFDIIESDLPSRKTRHRLRNAMLFYRVCCTVIWSIRYKVNPSGPLFYPWLSSWVLVTLLTWFLTRPSEFPYCWIPKLHLYCNTSHFLLASIQLLWYDRPIHHVLVCHQLHYSLCIQPPMDESPAVDGMSFRLSRP